MKLENVVGVVCTSRGWKVLKDGIAIWAEINMLLDGLTETKDWDIIGCVVEEE